MHMTDSATINQTFHLRIRQNSHLNIFEPDGESESFIAIFEQAQEHVHMDKTRVAPVMRKASIYHPIILRWDVRVQPYSRRHSLVEFVSRDEIDNRANAHAFHYLVCVLTRRADYTSVTAEVAR